MATFHHTTTATKRCTKCGGVFPATVEYFSRDAGKKDGLESRCKTCKAEKDLRYYAENLDKVRERKRRYHAENLDKVRERKRRYRTENPDKVRETNRRYYAGNLDKVREANRQWRAENLDKVRERIRRYYAENPDKVRETNRRYYAENLDKERERSRHYRAENPDKVRDAVRKWRAENPDKVRTQKQRRRARKRSLPHTLTATEWQACLEHFHNCCAYCGAQQSLWHVIEQEHVIPVSAGGAYTADNIVPACRSCNSSKKDSEVGAWLVARFGKRKANAVLAKIRAYFDSLE